MRYEKGKRIITIEDNYEFDYSVDVLNQLFDKGYEKWMQASCWLDDNKTMKAWFPKLAKYENGVAKPGGEHSEWINVLENDGKTLRMYSEVGLVSRPRGSEIRFAFARVPGDKYKYIGTFIEDLKLGNSYQGVFNRVSTVLNLDHLTYFSDSLDSNDNLDLAEQEEKEINSLGLTGSDRLAVVKQRVNQGKFRDILLKKYNHCCLCGVSNKELLIASHIKPWSESKADEQLNPNNGFLMCPNHDKLFDKGYISFDDEGNIIISQLLSDTDLIFMNIDKSMHIELTAENKKYLSYHRNNIFKK